MSYALPGIILLLAFVAIAVGFLAAPAIWKLRRLYNPEATLATPADLWLCALTRCPCLTLIFGILLPCTFGLFGAAASGFSVNVNLDFAEYLEAELEVQYLLNVATEASLEQVRKPFDTNLEETFNGWSVERYNRFSANSAVESNDASAPARGLQYEGVPLIYRLWKLEIFYEAVDPEKGIFTEEALMEIRDFEHNLVSFPEYSKFCRRFKSYGGLPCDVPSSVKNIFFTMPNASSGSTMDLVYDGSGNLANIELALQELAREEVRWWTDSDFNGKNLKSRYTRSTFHGGAPLLGYTNWADRNAEQEAKIYDFLGLLFKDYLRRADVPETDPIRLPYKHIYVTWYEKRMQNYEILHYLWLDMLFAFGTLATVTSMVLMRLKNIFITFFAAVGVLLAFVASYYFHFVIAGFTSLSLLDFVSFFVIMGIAADDVFLMYNAYQLAVGVDPKVKMIIAFKEASSAMLVTSVTTCGSFCANCFSVIKVVRSFGFFMAAVVAWNFINVLTIFPSAILVNELYILPYSPCKQRSKGATSAPKRHGDEEVTRSKQELGSLSKCLWPCISWARWLLLSASVVLSLICLILATESFKISEGEIQIFEEDLNLGRLQKLRKEVFPDAPGDSEKALEVNPPGRTVRVDACPGEVNGTWCSGQGTCDTGTSSCRCDDGFVGQGCSVRRVNGSIELVYLSASDLFDGTQLQDFDYVHAHVLASPSLTEVPTTTTGSIDFFILNSGDDPVPWQLAATPTTWFSLSSTEGTVPPRSFSRTDDMYLGRDDFAGSIDLFRKPVAWQESTTLTLSTAERSQQVSIGAFVVPPASLTQLLVSEWDSGAASPVPLQPTFSVSYGFESAETENLVLRSVQILYEVEVRSPEILVQAEAESGLYALTVDGLPKTSTLVTVPQDMPRIITIQVASAFQSTTYTLRASRNCDGPCTTTSLTTTSFTQTTIPGATTSTVSTTTSTRTTTQDFDAVVGLLTLDVLNCPALQSVEGRSVLASSIATIAEVDMTATKVDLWCGRRLGDARDRRLQKVGAEMRYTIATEKSLTDSVTSRLREETEQSMTQKLQASLNEIASLVVQLEVLSLQPPEVNPDPTTTVTLTSTRSSVTTLTSSTGSTSVTSTGSITETMLPATTVSSTQESSTLTTSSTVLTTLTTSKTTVTTATATSTTTITTSVASATATGTATTISNTVTTTRTTMTTMTTTVMMKIMTVTTSSVTSMKSTTSTVTRSITATSEGTTVTTEEITSSGRRRTVTTSTTTEVITSSATSGTSDVNLVVTTTTIVTTTVTTVTTVTSITTSVISSTQRRTPSSITSTSSSSGSSTVTSSTTTATSTESITSHTSTGTSFTSTTYTSSTITVTYLEGFDYISGEVEFLVSDCAVVNGDLGHELLRQSLAQVAEVDASYITVQVQCQVPGRRLQVSLTTAYGSYGIAIPPERSPELFPVAMVKLQNQQSFLQQTLDSALVGTGLVVLVLNAEVTSGPAPTTSSTSSTTLCPGLPTCMGKGKCERLFNWQCVCEDTYSGLDCSRRICPSCQNNGSCVEGGQDLESPWTCKCPEHFVGRMCERLHCPGDCNGGGDCDNMTGRCTCLTGFKGHDCSIKDVPLSNAIEILLVFGLKGYQATNRSAPSYDASTKLLDPTAQVHLLSACREAKENVELRVKDEMPCWIEAFETFMISRGGAFPVNDADLMAEAFQAFLYLWESGDLGYRRDVRTAGLGFDGDLLFTRLRMKVNMAVNAEKSERRKLRRRWEDYVEQLNSRAPAAAGQALMVSINWRSMELEDRVFASTITAFSLSLMTSLVAVTLFTRNVTLAFYVCCTILLVVCVLSGCLLKFLQYDFGVVEAIGATVFVGLSVDYCLHLAHGYFHAPGRSRAEKLHHALRVLTPSILGGAVTTVAACAFLLPCRMILFRKLGWTLLLNATISIVYTFSFLAPLLLIAGPLSAPRSCCGVSRGHKMNSAVAPEVPESTEPVNASTKDGTVDWRETEEVPEPPMVLQSASASEAEA